MGPNSTGTDVIILKRGESRDDSKPPDEMKLVSDLSVIRIPDPNCMSVDEPENIPLNKLIQYRPSNRSASPSKISATNAIANLKLILRPPRASGKGYRRATLNHNLETQIQDMLSLLRLFLPESQWVKASLQVAVTKG